MIKMVKKYFEKKLKNILSVQKKFLLLHSQTKTEVVFKFVNREEIIKIKI